MICLACRGDEHAECGDRERRGDVLAGLIPAGRLADSAWCYCAHQPREDDEERAVRAALQRHGYDPDLAPRGVTGGPGAFEGYRTEVAGGLVPCLLRNWACVLDGILIDGHSDPDGTGMCIYCLEEWP